MYVYLLICLLQGSTSVYSRKVEHVYQLVQSTIDFLTQQKQQKNANAGASKNKNGDDDMAGEVIRSLVRMKHAVGGTVGEASLEAQVRKRGALTCGN